MACTVCKRECTGQYCSGACRAKASRARKAHANAPEARARAEAHAVTKLVVDGASQIEDVDALDAAVFQPYPGGPDCTCRMCANWKAKGKDTAKLNHGWQDANGLGGTLNQYELNRVPLPGDADYEGVCREVDGAWQVQEATA